MVRDHRIENYDFKSGTGQLVGDVFRQDTWRQVNGILMAVKTKENNYGATGSLFLVESGTNNVIWSLTSGTSTGNTSQSGLYYPVTPAVNPINATMSGTNSAGVYVDIPLFGAYAMIGSGVGASKSGLGVEIIYRMG